ncbi:carbohydrate binding domain-containing protein [Sphingopyxis fribergensis]
MIKFRAVFFAVAFVFAAAPVSAEEEAGAPHMLNEPTAGWNVYGPGQTHKARKDAGVQGGSAMRVTIPAKPANPWDIGASVPISGAIAKGDKLILAFWVRLADGGAEGPADLGAAIQQNSAPYAPIVSGRVALSGDWKLVHLKGIAAEDHPAGKANVALTLGDAARTIDLGPAFVMKAD